MFDILITVAEKDFNKLRFVLSSIERNITGFDEVYCISNVKIPKNAKECWVNYVLDSEVLDFNFQRMTGTIKARQGWYKQQYIKLFQNVTSDEYLVVDADVYFNKKIEIIENGKPTFLFGTDQFHPPYFHFMKNMFDLERVYPFSFINELMYFKRGMIQHILSSIKVNKYGFFELSVNELNKENNASGFSEYELYGNYVTKYFPTLYNYKYIKTYSTAKKEVWSDQDIRKHIAQFKYSDIDILKIHSWL
jgi:hypothetical protein